MVECAILQNATSLMVFRLMEGRAQMSIRVMIEIMEAMCSGKTWVLKSKGRSGDTSEVGTRGGGLDIRSTVKEGHARSWGENGGKRMVLTGFRDENVAALSAKYCCTAAQLA